jgi:tetratricopeptide (TPR) repeat protein
MLGLGGQEQEELPAPAAPQDQFARTLKELEARVAADPEDVNSRLELAVYYKRMMDVKRAVPLLEEVLVLDAANQRARVDLAEIHLGIGSYDQAVEQLEALLEINPEHQLGLYLYGVTLGFGKGDYLGAVQALERFLVLVDTGPDAEHARALIEEWTKN